MLNRGTCIALATLTIGLLIFAGHEMARYTAIIFEIRQLAQDSMSDNASIAVILLIYIIALAIPFVPGVEFGMLLLAVFGAKLSGVVYLATIVGLMFSFTIGRFVPGIALQRFLLRLGMISAARIVTTARYSAIRSTSRELEQLNIPHWLKMLFKHRICWLILLINAPGNTVLGGGGGIALAAGTTRFCTFSEFILGVSIATAPIPVVLTLLSLWGT